MKSKKNKLFTVIIIIIVSIFLLTSLSASIYYYNLTYGYDLDREKLNTNTYNMCLYNSNNELIDYVATGDNNVCFSDIPKRLINAVIAVEDKRFFSHNGVDYKRIIGAIVSNIKSKSLKEGASTISQQVIKNTHLTSEKTIKRKLIELKLARKLEKAYSKNEILEIYLNKVYLGNNIYGVKDAAKYYYDKELADLNLLECASIAGILKNPSKYVPSESNIDNSLSRAKLILKLMLEQGYITQTEYDSAVDSRLVITNKSLNNNNSYVKSAIAQAEKILGINELQIKLNEYKIYTNLDENLNDYCARMTNSQLKDLGNIDSSTIIMDNRSGNVISYYNSLGKSCYDQQQYIGSTIKPLCVYAPALEQGIIYESSVFCDEKKSFGNYSPSNYGNAFYGDVTARTALAKSLNIPAVEIYSKLDSNYVQSILAKMNINVNNNEGLARALGGTTNKIAISSLVGAYSTLSRYGDYIEPSFISKIVSKDGRVIYRNNNVSTNVFSRETSYILSDMLKECVQSGTAKILSSQSYDICAKTGTVSAPDNKYNTDAYCASYTKENTVVCWIGKDSGQMSGKITGGNYPTIISKNLYNYMYADKSPDNFEQPSTVSSLPYQIEVQDDNSKELRLLPLSETSYQMGLFDTTKPLPQLADKYYIPSPEDITKTIINDQIILGFNAPSAYKIKAYSNGFLFSKELDVNIENGIANICYTKKELFSNTITIRFISENLDDYEITISF